MTGPALNPEAVQRMTEQMNEAVTKVRAAMVPGVARAAETMRQLHVALRPVIEHMEQHPELWEQARLAREAEPGSCHCLCGSHRAQAEGVCQGEAAPGVTFTFNSPTVGTQHVRMCVPCQQAHVERAADPLTHSPDAMHVSFGKSGASAKA